MEWVRIPAELKSEDDRRTLAAILVANGLAVREVKVKETSRGTPKRFIEYAKQPKQQKED